jgi:hypothetical protein
MNIDTSEFQALNERALATRDLISAAAKIADMIEVVAVLPGPRPAGAHAAAKGGRHAARGQLCVIEGGRR